MTENVTVEGGEGEELLSLDQAVRFLGISRPTVYRMLAQGELKGLRVGRQWRFSKGDLMNHAMRQPTSLSPMAVDDAATELLHFRSELQAAGVTDASEDVGEVDPAFATVIRLCNAVLRLGLVTKATDIHFEPRRTGDAEELLVRFRVDGVLQPVRRMPKRLAEPIFDRYKLMAGMDLGERKAPQSGRIPVVMSGVSYEIRVATLPVMGGEAMTLRVVVRDLALPDLDRVGVTGDLRQRFDPLLHQPNGLILVSGPTGSGKTTTLYAAVQSLAGDGVKTMTIEDPVELAVPHTTQVQVNPRGGITAAGALRAAMMHDPDVLMVGDLWDPEIADLLVQAVMCGQRVLCQLHADSAAEAIARFASLCADPYYAGVTIIGAMNQRLVRRVCEGCAETVDPASDASATIASIAGPLAAYAGPEGVDALRGATFRFGRGCPACRSTGYKGRIALYELTTVDDEMGTAIRRRAPEEELAAMAMAAGQGNLALDGLRKVAAGVTTVEEVMRVLGTNV